MVASLLRKTYRERLEYERSLLFLGCRLYFLSAPCVMYTSQKDAACNIQIFLDRPFENKAATAVHRNGAVSLEFESAVRKKCVHLPYTDVGLFSLALLYRNSTFSRKIF